MKRENFEESILKECYLTFCDVRTGDAEEIYELSLCLVKEEEHKENNNGQLKRALNMKIKYMNKRKVRYDSNLERSLTLKQKEEWK